MNNPVIQNSYQSLPSYIQSAILDAKERIVKAKKRNGKVVVAVGSGPNLHEGVTTLIAELMHKGIIDGVCTSSAVVSHEMAGTLDKVKRADGRALGFSDDKLPSFGMVEATVLPPDIMAQYCHESQIDDILYQKILQAPGGIIVKAAGNMAYPAGLRTEQISRQILHLAKKYGRPFEEIAGLGADPMTIIGAGAKLNKPVLVSVTQLVGGGRTGLAIGDSISISERSFRMAKLLDSADVIIESAIALCQEIHDGPFETYTGHGIWSDWEDEWTFSLADKQLIRIDLDPNLEVAWLQERSKNEITEAVKKGLPKAKVTGLPFRMEMSGFARIPGSLPIVYDIGTIWPILALLVADELNISLDFISYNQALEEGRKMREWIVETIRPVDMALILEELRTL
nr:hypothetical protein [Desulfobulbaceae bacterium]